MDRPTIHRIAAAVPSRWRTLALFLPLVVAAPLCAQTTGREALLDAWSGPLADFARALSAQVAADDVGGLTAGVMFDGEVAWSRGFGWADREAGIPAGPTTVYRTGSISKSFTAALAVLLEERGLLDLDDPLTEHLPEAAGLPGAGPVTLRHLATHTAGLIREPDLEGAASGPIEGWEHKVLASIPRTSSRTEPGVRYAYSNIGFGILGLALSRAAARPFTELVTEEIFRPLGMSSSTFVVGGELEARLATGYANRRDGTVDRDTPALEHRGRGYKVPNGGIYSTVGDLGRFMAAVSGRSGRVLFSSSAREAMTSVQTLDDPERGYGLGFSVVVRADGRRFVGHGGSVAGYTAHMLFEPESGVGVVLLRNYNVGSTDLGGSAATLLGALLERMPAASPAGAGAR